MVAMFVGLTSCNMDTPPVGVINPEDALLNYTDAVALRTGLYISFRGNVAGDVVYSPELQSDFFHATTSFGNRGGDFYEWTFTSANGSALGWWAGYYGSIANINFFLAAAEAVDTEKNEWTADEKANLEIFKGEAYFMRAMYHYILADKFCQNYVGNEATYGIPYVTEYAPTSDQTKYPQRGTLEDTYTNIMNDLEAAAQRISTPGQLASIWITSDVVKALTARVALSMGDYTKAINNASAIIDSARYPLVTSASDMNDLWVNDSGKECLFMTDADFSTGSLPPTNNYDYLGYNAAENVYAPGYVPEQWVIDLYDAEDIRFGQFFKNLTITLTGNITYDLYVFYKFPGNPELRQGDNDQNYINKAKPFRAAEMYLVLAEAYARNSDATNANAILNDLRAKRIPGYAPQNYSGQGLLDEILKERVRELIGEGYRISDLKRFGKGVERGDAQESAAIYQPHNYEVFERGADDFRMVYPIPQEELDSNPNMKGQQNQGY